MTVIDQHQGIELQPSVEAVEKEISILQERLREVWKEFYVGGYNHHGVISDVDDIFYATNIGTSKPQSLITEVVPVMSRDKTQDAKTVEKQAPYQSGAFFDGVVKSYIRFKDTEEGKKARDQVVRACELSQGGGMLPTEHRLAKPTDPVFHPYEVTIILDFDSYSAEKLFELGAKLVEEETKVEELEVPEAQIYQLDHRRNGSVAVYSAIAGN